MVFHQPSIVYDEIVANREANKIFIFFSQIFAVITRRAPCTSSLFCPGTFSNVARSYFSLAKKRLDSYGKVGGVMSWTYFVQQSEMRHHQKRLPFKNSNNHQWNKMKAFNKISNVTWQSCVIIGKDGFRYV